MNGELPQWLARLMNVPRAGSGEGTAWGLEHSWNWPPWLTLLLLAGITATVVACYTRETGPASRAYRGLLCLLRLALVGIVLFMLASMVLSLDRTGLPWVVVIVDDSASMGVDDRYDEAQVRRLIERKVREAGLKGTTRLDQAKSLLISADGALVRSLGRRYKLKLYYLSDRARAQTGTLKELLASIRDLDATGADSRLGQGVMDVLADLRGTPPTAIVLLSDGITTAGPTLSEAANQARRKGVPLYTIGLGSNRPTRDLELADMLVDEVVFVDDIVNFEISFTATGYEGRPFRIILRKDDEREPLAETTVTAGAPGETTKVRIPYRPREVGDFEYVVEVGREADELKTDNNSERRQVSVRKEQVRVLFVQSYPSWEFRYLKHLLERDGTIELRTVLQEADLEYAEVDPSARTVFPVRREELFEYDVLIFGDVDPSFMSRSALEHIEAFVSEKGGGVIFIAGPLHTPMEYRETPLAGLLPIEFSSALAPDPGQVVSEPFQMAPTDLGLASPALQLGDTPAQTQEIWQRLPPLYWFFEAPSLKPAARVLAEHSVRQAPDGRPLALVALQYVGAGKVLFHGTDETWRWRFRVGDVFMARYWVQTIRYLSRGKLLGRDRSAELVVDRREYRRGEPVRLRVRFFDDRQAPASDDGVAVTLEREGNKSHTVQLRRSALRRGIFETTVSRLGDGRYHAWVATPTLEGDAPSANFQVVAPPGELAKVELDVAELERTASTTKGRYYSLATASKLLNDLPAGRQVKTDVLPPVVLWNKWPVLLTFLVLLTGEWLLRKRRAML